MMVCKLCGFRASERRASQVGSMNLHSLQKHGEPDYKKLFEEITEEKNAGPEGSAAETPKHEGKTAKTLKEWRLLNPKDPRERLAIRAGYSLICESGSDPETWDIK